MGRGHGHSAPERQHRAAGMKLWWLAAFSISSRSSTFDRPSSAMGCATLTSYSGTAAG